MAIAILRIFAKKLPAHLYPAMDLVWMNLLLIMTTFYIPFWINMLHCVLVPSRTGQTHLGITTNFVRLNAKKGVGKESI